MLCVSHRLVCAGVDDVDPTIVKLRAPENLDDAQVVFEVGELTAWLRMLHNRRTESRVIGSTKGVNRRPQEGRYVSVATPRQALFVERDGTGSTASTGLKATRDRSQLMTLQELYIGSKNQC